MKTTTAIQKTIDLIEQVLDSGVTLEPIKSGVCPKCGTDFGPRTTNIGRSSLNHHVEQCTGNPADVPKQTRQRVEFRRSLYVDVNYERLPLGTQRLLQNQANNIRRSHGSIGHQVRTRSGVAYLCPFCLAHAERHDVGVPHLFTCFNRTPEQHEAIRSADPTILSGPQRLARRATYRNGKPVSGQETPSTALRSAEQPDRAPEAQPDPKAPQKALQAVSGGALDALLAVEEHLVADLGRYRAEHQDAPTLVERVRAGGAVEVLERALDVVRGSTKGVAL